MEFDAFGMCNAIFDVQAEIADEGLAKLDLVPGSMSLVDQDRQRVLRDAVGNRIVNAEAGGSGANTMIGLAQLGGRTCFSSKVGDDELGARYRSSLERWGVKANLGLHSADTGVSVVLITPDAQRTMNTYLGASQSMLPQDVVLDDLRSSRFLYVTGYLWDTDGQKEAVLHAMREANKAGVKVAFSLADLFCVDRHRSDFSELLDAHVDIVLANEDEARALTGLTDTDAAVRELARRGGHLAVVTCGGQGSYLCDERGVTEVGSHPVDLVDTTGAGDMYAAGILFGLSRGLDWTQTGRLASWLASQVISQYGPRLETFDRDAAFAHAGIRLPDCV